jgi:hypothetical protein
MPQTVRFVSDGEEMLLSEGETARIRAGRLPAERAAGLPNTKPIVIQYQGFQDVRDRREYRFDARRGEQARRYTVWIELAAFSGRHALLQDGPDICYQKLARDVAGVEFQGPDGIQVTESDLAAYRETHAVPSRKRATSSPYPPPKPAPR